MVEIEMKERRICGARSGALAERGSYPVIEMKKRRISRPDAERFAPGAGAQLGTMAGRKEKKR
jgi:hypothetical protein